MLGDGAVELHNLQGDGAEPRLQGENEPETNLLERQSRKGLDADALPRLPWATSYIMSARSEKLFNGPNQTRFRFTGLFTL